MLIRTPIGYRVKTDIKFPDGLINLTKCIILTFNPSNQELSIWHQIKLSDILPQRMVNFFFQKQGPQEHFLDVLTKTKIFPYNLSTGSPDFVFKKKHRPILGCVPSARTWGTPDSVQKTISLDAIYTTFLKAMSIFFCQI